jgi:hypothetical protein
VVPIPSRPFFEISDYGSGTDRSAGTVVALILPDDPA